MQLKLKLSYNKRNDLGHVNQEIQYKDFEMIFYRNNLDLPA